jgi:hypothetical protein
MAMPSLVFIPDASQIAARLGKWSKPDTKPTVAVWLEQDAVFAVLLGIAMVLGQKIYQPASGFISTWKQQGIIAPCIFIAKTWGFPELKE